MSTYDNDPGMELPQVRDDFNPLPLQELNHLRVVDQWAIGVDLALSPVSRLERHADCPLDTHAEPGGIGKFNAHDMLSLYNEGSGVRG